MATESFDTCFALFKASYTSRVSIKLLGYYLFAVKIRVEHHYKNVSQVGYKSS